MNNKKEYIEREAAFAALCEYCDGGACKDSGNNECAEYRKIRLIPAADVESVRHGEWEQIVDLKTSQNRYQHTCGACGKSIFDDNKFNYPYCPNCGAKMDGKGET